MAPSIRKSGGSKKAAHCSIKACVIPATIGCFGWFWQKKAGTLAGSKRQAQPEPINLAFYAGLMSRYFLVFLTTSKKKVKA
jgi:hypothetical protein